MIRRLWPSLLRLPALAGALAVLPALAAVALPAAAQRLVDVRDPAGREFATRIHRVLAEGQPDSLACKVASYRPALNLALRHQAG